MTIKLDEVGATQLRTLRRSSAQDMVSMCREIGEDPATYFEGEDWSGLDLRACDLGGVSFKGAVMDRTIMTPNQERIVRATNPLTMGDVRIEKDPKDLAGADLSGRDLSEANLIGADLIGANLYGADLRQADLIGADLELADCNRMRINSARLQSASLKGARNLTQAQIDSAEGNSETVLPEGLVRPAHW